MRGSLGTIVIRHNRSAQGSVKDCIQQGMQDQAYQALRQTLLKRWYFGCGMIGSASA